MSAFTFLRRLRRRFMPSPEVVVDAIVRDSRADARTMSPKGQIDVEGLNCLDVDQLLRLSEACREEIVRRRAAA